MADRAAVDRFLQALSRSGLMPPAAVQEVIDAVPDKSRKDARRLAEHFVRLGKLSHFQARKLLDGTAGGLVLGPYHVVMPIGRGGMGTVYLARDTKNPRLLALKVLPPKKARGSDRMLQRFRREMELSQRVAHPNLTQTYDVGVEQGVYYIAMEYIAGVSLFRVVATGGPLPVARAAKLFSQAALGLDSAHSGGLIHRDLKPSNLMVTPRDQVKVLDLGLAIMMDEEEGDIEVIGGKGYVVGSMDYIAPEQTLDAAAVDARSDLYGLGAAMYYALTGYPPFPGGDMKSKIRRHRKELPTPLQDMNPLVPAEFAAIVHALLAKRPADRPQSALEVRQLLLPFADPEPPPYVGPAVGGPDVVARLEEEAPAETEFSWSTTPVAAGAANWLGKLGQHSALWWSVAGFATLIALLIIAELFRRLLR